MTTLTLTTGDALVIEFAHTDGQFEIHFDSKEAPDQILIRETAGLDGNVVGKALQTMYKKVFVNPVVLDAVGPDFQVDDANSLVAEMASHVKCQVEEGALNSQILNVLDNEFPQHSTVFNVVLAEMLPSDFTCSKPTVVFSTDRRHAGEFSIYNLLDAPVIQGLRVIQDQSTKAYWYDVTCRWVPNVNNATEYVDPVDAHLECEAIFKRDGNYSRQLKVVLVSSQLLGKSL